MFDGDKRKKGKRYWLIINTCSACARIMCDFTSASIDRAFVRTLSLKKELISIRPLLLESQCLPIHGNAFVVHAEAGTTEALMVGGM